MQREESVQFLDRSQNFLPSIHFSQIDRFFFFLFFSRSASHSRRKIFLFFHLNLSCLPVSISSAARSQSTIFKFSRRACNRHRPIDKTVCRNLFLFFLPFDLLFPSKKSSNRIFFEELYIYILYERFSFISFSSI